MVDSGFDGTRVQHVAREREGVSSSLPPMLVIERHGFSAFNRSKNQTFPDPRLIPLDELGESQSRRAGLELYLQKIRPEVIVVSDTTRSQQTAELEKKELVRRGCPPPEIELWEDLHELEHLKYFSSDKDRREKEGKRYWEEILDPDYRAGHAEALQAIASGNLSESEYEKIKSETFREFIGRVDKIIERMRTVTKRTVIVGHEYFIDALEWRMGNSGDIGENSVFEYREFKKRKVAEGRRVENTSLYGVDLEGGKLDKIYSPSPKGSLLSPQTILPPTS